MAPVALVMAAQSAMNSAPRRGGLVRVEAGLLVERLVVVDRVALQRHRAPRRSCRPWRTRPSRPAAACPGRRTRPARTSAVDAVADLPAAVEEHDVGSLAGLDRRAEQRVVLVERLRDELDRHVRVLLGEVGLRLLHVRGRGRVTGLPVPDHELAAGRTAVGDVRSGGAPAARTWPAPLSGRPTTVLAASSLLTLQKVRGRTIVLRVTRNVTRMTSDVNTMPYTAVDRATSPANGRGRRGR